MHLLILHTVSVKHMRFTYVSLSKGIFVFSGVVFVVPTFDTKVTEYLRSRWVFFSSAKFDFLTSHF